MAFSSLMVPEFEKVELCANFQSTQSLNKLLNIKSQREDLIIFLNITDLIKLLRAAPSSACRGNHIVYAIPGSVPFFLLFIFSFSLSNCRFYQEFTKSAVCWLITRVLHCLPCLCWLEGVCEIPEWSFARRLPKTQAIQLCKGQG